MASIKPAIAIAVGVALAAGAAAAVYFTQYRPSVSAVVPLAAPSATPPATPPAQPAAPDEPANVSAQDVASVEFAPIAQPFSLIRDSAAYVAASGDAPQMYPLRAGTGLKAVEKSKDDKWIVSLTEDGQAAYLPAPDLGPYDPNHTPAPALPATLSGTPQVVDTATLTIDGEPVHLSGVVGESGTYADAMQAMITAQGPQVNCSLQGQAYRCLLPNGLDVARAALYNGGAKPTDDASDDYKAQASAARTAGRGIWK
jgi:hypothetical protein